MESAECRLRSRSRLRGGEVSREWIKAEQEQNAEMDPIAAARIREGYSAAEAFQYARRVIRERKRQPKPPRQSWWHRVISQLHRRLTG